MIKWVMNLLVEYIGEKMETVTAVLPQMATDYWWYYCVSVVVW